MNLWRSIKKNKLRFGCLVILLFMCFLVAIFTLLFYIVRTNYVSTLLPSVFESTILVSSPVEPDVKVLVGESKTIQIPTGYFLNIAKLPSFIKYNDNSLVISPEKFDDGDYVIEFTNGSSSIETTITVAYNDVDFDAMKRELISYLNVNGLFDKYGIWIKDLGRNTVTGINNSVIFPPASMAKMTMAILILRDIDAGKYTLDTTYPIQDDVKFSTDDELGELPAGTQVPIHTYLERLIEDSNNTAWYHMDKFLGGSYEAVNPRTVNELGVNPLFLNPHIGTAEMLGKLFDDLYNARTVSVKSRDYLINLMENALEWNRQGIGLGLPDGIQFANKIGNLWTDNDINYCDSAIVYGKNTNYIMIVMDKDIDWDSGRDNLEGLSKIVYSFLDN
ncbi:MAG: serine hydrolase [Candidatus Dojkabacteria bacterium]